MKFATQQEADLWKSIILKRVIDAGTTVTDDIKIADASVLAFRERMEWR